MTAQDDAREKQLIDLFNLKRPAGRARHGVDAVLEIEGRMLEFELKSVTTGKESMSTVRDLGRDHIEKWRGQHWIVAFYNKGDLRHCHYLSPEDMAPWIEKIWQYIKPDFELSDAVPQLVGIDTLYRLLGNKNVYTLEDAKRLQKKQYTVSRYAELKDSPEGYSPERMLEILRDRVGYLMRRGSTLNNPHVNPGYFESFPAITEDHASILRGRIKQWLHSKTD